MTRVSLTNAHGAHAPAALDRPRAVSKKKKKPYKIVLEAVTQEKRKLQSIVSYHDQAPPGFGYIPVGYPEITEWCKEQCRQRNLDVHIVSAKPKNRTFDNPDKISHHVHRIGHHFPLDIIDLACSKYGYTFTDHGGLQKERSGGTSYGEEYFQRGIADYQQRQRLHGRPVTDGESKDNIHGAVREMFPKIPEADLEVIVNHAFQKGTNRVGNAKELPLARRIQLAVVAHIRHTYTEYDDILKNKTGSWVEARQRVEHVSLAKLKEWRDEAGQASNELEETFREVIVLDDDEMEQASSDDGIAHTDTRAPSMEIFSSRATARDLQPEPIDPMHGNIYHGARAPQRTVYLQPVFTQPRSSFHPTSLDTHPASQTFRADPRAPPPPVAAMRPLSHVPEVPRTSYIRPVDIRREPVRSGAYPMQMRDADGRLYNLQPIEEPRTGERVRRIDGPLRPASDYVPTTVHRYTREDVPSRLATHSSRPVLAPSSRRASDQDLVLPSVEREPGVVSEVPLGERHRGDAVNYHDIQTPKRQCFPLSIHSPQEQYFEQGAKRMRPAHDEPYAQFRPRVQPTYEPGNLTSSPSGQRELYARPNGQVYTPAPAKASPRAYVPEYDRLYGTRVLAPIEHSAARGDSAHFVFNSSRHRLH